MPNSGRTDFAYFSGKLFVILSLDKTSELSDFCSFYFLNFNLFCNDNVCLRIFAWPAPLPTSLS